MKVMYCQKYGGPEVYQLKELDKPTPREDELLVKVYRAIVSPTDANFRSGSPFIARLFSGLFSPKKKVHGEMFAGIVHGIGESIKDFKVGDIVYGTNGMALGAYADYLTVNIKEAIKKVPKDLNYKEVLPLLDGGITALPFLKELGKVKEGDHVLVNGASGAVGSMGVMIAKHLGATVTGVCSTKNVDLVKSLGADHVIDYKQEDFTKQENTYDLIFDAVGKSNFSICKKSLIEHGMYITTVPTLGVMWQAMTKKNSNKKKTSFMAAGLRKPDVKIRDLEYLEELVRQKEIKALHSQVFPFEKLGEAQAYVETGHKVGNVTLSVNE